MASSTDRRARRRAVGQAARRIDHIGVVVPAHNEEAWICDCLQSLVAANAHVRAEVEDPPRVHVTVVLDACSDGTERRVATFRDVATIRIAHQRVGFARRAGTDQVLRALPIPHSWIASTDADGMVPLDWLTTMTRLGRDGADLVLGTVEPWPPLRGVTLERWRAEYRPHDGHCHVHGANLGVRADVYRDIGGWPPVPSDEDVLLAARAQAAGLSIVRTGAIPVRTSSRLVARAPAGFAHYLGALAQPRPRSHVMN